MAQGRLLLAGIPIAPTPSRDAPEKLEYREAEVGEDACRASGAIRFGKRSNAPKLGDSAPYISGLRRTAACSPRRGRGSRSTGRRSSPGSRLERPRLRDPVEQERESVADRRLLDHTGDSDRPAGRARRLVLPRPWPEPVASEEAGDDVVVAGSTPRRRPALPHRPPLADCEQTRTEPRSNAHRRWVSFGGQRRRERPSSSVLRSRGGTCGSDSTSSRRAPPLTNGHRERRAAVPSLGVRASCGYAAWIPATASPSRCSMRKTRSRPVISSVRRIRRSSETSTRSPPRSRKRG